MSTEREMARGESERERESGRESCDDRTWIKCFEHTLLRGSGSNLFKDPHGSANTLACAPVCHAPVGHADRCMHAKGSGRG